MACRDRAMRDDSAAFERWRRELLVRGLLVPFVDRLIGEGVLPKADYEITFENATTLPKSEWIGEYPFEEKSDGKQGSE